MSIDVIGPPAGVSTQMTPVQVPCNGATVKNNGPDTVYYADTPDVTTSSYDGSLGSGSATVLDGNQWMVVAAGARAEVALGQAASTDSALRAQLRSIAHRLQAVRYSDAFPAQMTTPPGTAFTSPGGSNPITSPVEIPWASQRVTVRGAVLTKVAIAGQNYGENATNGGTPGGGIPGQYSIEFDYHGSDLALRFKQRALNGAIIWAWVDGQPVTASPEGLTAAASASAAFYRLTFPTAAQRRIQFQMAVADFGGVEIGPTDSLTPTREPLTRVAVIGDSWWDQATGANFPQEGIGPAVGRLLGVEMCYCAMAGSGYLAPGVYSKNYQDATRIAGLRTLNPDLVIVSGTSNDDVGGFTGPQIRAAATAVYRAIGAALPGVPIVVIGPPCLTSVSTPQVRIDNRDAVKAAAAAASNVVGFIDPLDPRGVASSTAAYVNNQAYAVTDLVIGNRIVQECRTANTRSSFTVTDWNPTTWITGSGKVGATAGDGNADIMITNDGAHPTPNGHPYLARVEAEAVLKLFKSLAGSLR